MRKLLFLLVLFAASSAFAQHSVTLNWTAPSSGGTVTGYQVQRATVHGGPYSTICGGTGQPACPTTAVTFVDTFSGFVEGSTYFYVVEATGPGGVSVPSNEASALIPFLPPGAPSGLSSVPK